LFLIGWFLKKILLWNRLAKWIETWEEASLEGPLLKWSFSSNPFTKKNRPIRNKNYLWRPCLLMDRDKMSTL
jgi:hypothetical protein